MKACFLKRRRLCLLLLTVLVFCFSSCRAKERDHLSYQEYPIKAQCVLSVGGEEYPFSFDLSSADNARLTFTGSRLEGGVIGISGSQAFFINGGYTFPLTLSHDSALTALLSGFSLSSAEMTKVTETENGLLVSYAHGDTQVTVTLAGGIPVSMEFATDSGTFTLAINEFTSGG